MGLGELFKAKSKAAPVDERMQVLTTQPRTYSEWRRWVHELGLIIEPGEGLVFSDEPVIKGNQVPARWGYELYCLGCGRRPDGGFQAMTQRELRDLQTEYVIKASRAGGKTLMIAIVGFTLCIWNDNYQWNHTAAVTAQAERVWGYLRDRLLKEPVFERQLAKRTTKTDINFANGSNANILTGNESGQNSKHPQFQTYDEVELMDINVIREGRLAAIRKRRPGGMSLPSLAAYISTQKKANKTMFTLIQEAKAGKKRLITSSIFDVLERCEPWRTEDLPDGLRCEDWGALTDEIAKLTARGESLNLQQRMQVQALEHARDMLRENCAIVEDCQGCAKRGCGHYSIDDAVKKASDRPYWLAQMMGKQPQMEHAVYSQFSEDENVSEEADYNRDLAAMAFIDYGFMQDPTYVCLGQLVGTCLCISHELLVENISSDLVPGELERWLKTVGMRRDDIHEVMPDPSANELHKHLRNAGFNVVIRRGKKARAITYGVDKVAELVYNRGVRRLLIHPRCVLLIENMMVYEKDASGMPKHRQWDHPVDALRYGVLWCAMQSRNQSRTITPGRVVGRTTR